MTTVVPNVAIDSCASAIAVKKEPNTANPAAKRTREMYHAA
jgi:hypothetical protein